MEGGEKVLKECFGAICDCCWELHSNCTPFLAKDLRVQNPNKSLQNTLRASLPFNSFLMHACTHLAFFAFLHLAFSFEPLSSSKQVRTFSPPHDAVMFKKNHLKHRKLSHFNYPPFKSSFTSITRCNQPSKSQPNPITIIQPQKSH
jgi:hypothetical protein